MVRSPPITSAAGPRTAAAPTAPIVTLEVKTGANVDASCMAPPAAMERPPVPPASPTAAACILSAVAFCLASNIFSLGV